MTRHFLPLLYLHYCWLFSLRLGACCSFRRGYDTPHICHTSRRIPRGGARRDDKSSIFSSIVRQSSQALAATARGSTQIAADLVRPKEVAWDELVGWWRLDMAMDDDNSAPPMTICLSADRRVRIANGPNDKEESEFVVEFRPASWPRSAKLKFGNPKQGFWYECTVQRKLANLDILKLRGKIYRIRRFQGKVQVGTFVGRRRVVVMDDEDEQDDDDKEEEEYDEDEDHVTEEEGDFSNQESDADKDDWEED